MDNKKPTVLSLLYALAAEAYIMLVVLIMNSADDIISETLNNFWGPVFFLTLFVVSAIITGTLILGRPIYLYLNDQRKEAIIFLIYTITWLFVPLITFFAIFIIVAKN